MTWALAVDNSYRVNKGIHEHCMPSLVLRSVRGATHNIKGMGGSICLMLTLA